MQSIDQIISELRQGECEAGDNNSANDPYESIRSEHEYLDVILSHKLNLESISDHKEMIKIIRTQSFLNHDTKDSVDRFLWIIGECESIFKLYFENPKNNTLLIIILTMYLKMK